MRRSLLRKNASGIVTPATLGANLWFDGSDVSKFTFTGSDVDTWESSIDSADTIDYNSRTACVRSDDAIATSIGNTSRYDYTGASHSLSGDFTLLWKAKTSVTGLVNFFIINDNPTYVYVVTSGFDFARYRDSTGSGGSLAGSDSSLSYNNLIVIGDSGTMTLYEDGVSVSSGTQGTGAIATGAYIMDNNTSLASSQTFLKQLIYFDRVLNSTELTQMNDFLDSK